MSNRPVQSSKLKIYFYKSVQKRCCGPIYTFYCWEIGDLTLCFNRIKRETATKRWGIYYAKEDMGKKVIGRVLEGDVSAGECENG